VSLPSNLILLPIFGKPSLALSIMKPADSIQGGRIISKMHCGDKANR
jgi:hypothetical protein